MYNQSLNDTISAISTSPGESGIGIVRLSGKEALKVADKIFVSKDGKKPSSFKSHTIHYGWITKGGKIDYSENIIDEVLLTVMRSPRTYTCEDIVEINCHGGIIALQAVLDLALENGCRLAEPGEFTKRAFLNGRIDLSQAEAVLDIIQAKTDSALKISQQQLKGNLSAEINRAGKKLLEILSLLEANIDFPEDGVGGIEANKISQQLAEVSKAISGILDSSSRGKILREGIHAVICGKPNVGKSSLLNALLKQERSIVTHIAGTTRDTIEEIIDIKGIPVRIVDTAGIIEPRDLVEKKAIQRSKRYIQMADLIILLFDSSRRIDKEDLSLIKKLSRKAVIAVINKIDLKPRLKKEEILKKFPNLVEISAKRLKNLNFLEQKIADLVFKGEVIHHQPVLVSNLRHIQSLRKTEKLVAQARNSLDNKLSLEFVAQDIKDALGYLDDILGKIFSEEVLDKIFSEFCIGK